MNENGAVDMMAGVLEVGGEGGFSSEPLPCLLHVA